MAATTLSHRILLLASLIVCGGGAYAAYSEASAYMSGGVLQEERFAALADDSQSTALSIASSRMVLDHCLEAITSVYGRLRTAPQRQAVATACMAQADAIVRTMPSYSYAWYVGALAATRLPGEDPSTRLQQSQLTGPQEQWIAELRVALAEDNRERLSDEARALNDKDLAMLVLSYRGVASIARRYVTNPDFRSRITDIVEQLPQPDQQRFVANVEAAARRTGGAR